MALGVSFRGCGYALCQAGAVLVAMTLSDAKGHARERVDEDDRRRALTVTDLPASMEYYCS